MSINNLLKASTSVFYYYNNLDLHKEGKSLREITRITRFSRCGIRIRKKTIFELTTELAEGTGLNNRRLTDEDPLEALSPVLTSHNVLYISKLASKIPMKDGCMLSSSSVHAAWLRKLFWKGDPQVLKKQPQSAPEYLHAYDTCAKYFERLFPSDITFL
ncbi:Neuroblastoma-amplified sequence [Acipenser ruthenus]|uniref:Neuroblastoma-amplified sequence n=1 Tax=Acipenser ruthenus TaxID=7906 RepID=A0A444UPB4_ACIRT|nr:Neuroblastoma-amplified sequence [Acipenser ruthenus]